MTVHSVGGVLSGQVAVGATVTVRGWVRTRRDSKAGVSFIHLTDGSCLSSLQLVAPNSLSNYDDAVRRLSSGCSIVATGTLAESQGRGQRLELVLAALEVCGWVEEPQGYPIQPKAHSLEFLREVAHLRPRTNTFGAMARIRDCLSAAVHRVLREEGFLWVHTPIVTASDCEGAGEMFRVSTLDSLNPPRRSDGQIDFAQDFFGKEAFLTVSGQLAVEAYCLALSKVYTFGPTFRAENSNTSRHLAEFWMVEPEVAFADLGDNAELAERFLKAIFQAVLKERIDDLEFCRQRIDPDCIARLERFIETSFERMEYGEAIGVLQKKQRKAKFEYPVAWGVDLQTEHERYLTDRIVKRPVVVTNYPKQIKAFYMRLNDDERTVAAMDVLAPGIGEIIGGAQREERLEVMDRRMEESGLNAEAYWWYRDLRRYGTVPHAGFGLGLERTMAYVTGMANVRDVIPFPRTPGNAEF